MVDNPWPVFAPSTRRGIKTILTELGSGIAERTDGTIRFSIDTTPEGDGSFKHRCYLQVVPLRYNYPFLVANHNMNMFPVTVEADTFEQAVTCQTEDGLVSLLKTIIASEQTRKVVEQLLDAAS